MRIPTIFILFIIFTLVLQYKLKKNDKANLRTNKYFWERENQAIFTRKKPLDTIKYITINTESLPLFSGDTTSSDTEREIFKIQQELLAIIEEPMVNLANKTNTDLKLEYGPANLKTLIAYENNYTHMIRILYKWGASLVSANKIEDALSVLECGMKAGTDISEHIILLGRIYIEKHDIDNYNKLLSQVNDSQSLLKNKIISSLERIMYKNL